LNQKRLSRSKAQKTRTRAQFPMKTSAKYFGLAVGPQSKQPEPKRPKNYFTYDASHKKSAIPNQKIIFRVQTRWLSNPFEALNSSLVQLASEL